MTQKLGAKSPKPKDAKAPKFLAAKRDRQPVVNLKSSIPDLGGMRWINFAALRFCALALNSK